VLNKAADKNKAHSLSPVVFTLTFCKFRIN